MTDMPNLEDSRVRELDRACSRAYLDMIDAVEEAGRNGLSVAAIAWYANLPETEVRYVLMEMCETDEEGRWTRS